MTRFALPLVVSLAAVVSAGCASSPKPSRAPAMNDCNQLRGEIARAEDEKRAAREKQEDAWKVVIPFAVVAQYVSGKTAVEEADRRLAELGGQSKRAGCAS